MAVHALHSIWQAQATLIPYLAGAFRLAPLPHTNSFAQFISEKAHTSEGRTDGREHAKVINIASIKSGRFDRRL